MVQAELDFDRVKLRLHQTLRNLKDLSYRSNLPSGSALSNLFSRTLFKSLFRSDPLCPKYFLTLFNILYYPLGSAASENIFPCFIPSLSLPHGSIGSAFSTLPISSDFSYSFRIAVLYVPLSHPHVLLVSPHDLFSWFMCCAHFSFYHFIPLLLSFSTTCFILVHLGSVV